MCYLVYYFWIKKKMLKQNQSKEFSFRNIAYESNLSNNNEGMNEPSINGAVYDYIRENEYATISSDLKENGANKDAGYTHHNREIFPKPSHLRKQDSHYTAIGKSGKNNVYNKLVYRNKPEKDSQSICKECGKKHQTKLQNSERVQSSASCCVKSFDGMSGFNKDNLNSKGNDYLILEPEPEYSMASAMAKTSSISSNSHNKQTKEQIGLYEKALPIQNNENKKSQNSINNYFTLEKIDNGQNDQSDREGEYVDSNENDYDHLHKKRQKGSQDHDHLYAHTCHDTKNDIAYDTAGAFLTRPCIDNTDYDTMLNVTKGITDA
ncbi:hypothetical protein KUTeg_015439 [Tegillarca granosa]|uniref:Uncharacterized protein n=1 Tax=Tegillarca granosa TaxID=220873 RepID=A0ABQ9EQB7_TEGGR|nr:hypothetical protein KUTeg_015439 [Tegillarca granosa]